MLALAGFLSLLGASQVGSACPLVFITFASTLALYQAPPAGIPEVTGLRLETPTMRE